MKPITITQDNFDRIVTSSAQPVLLDFWAPWCGPCQALGPVLDELATEQDGRALIGKVNVDDEPELAAKFNIRGIPTLIVFRDGQAVNTLTGLRGKAQLAAALAN
jgi:thioredoxin 1